MTKELKMIQMILEKGEATFWDIGFQKPISYNNFEYTGSDLIFISTSPKGEHRAHVTLVELEEPKTVYKQFMHALFDADEYLDTYDRLTKIKELVKKHEDFLREK